jgi:PAS domain S-box-containing protein
VETELQIAQKKFQAIFDNTADGIYQSTIDGKFIMANPSMARIFGYDSTEELIRSVTDISNQIYANPADRKQMSELISSQGHIENYELQVLTKHKERIWVSANIRVVRDENAGFSCFEGTLEDISERKKSEEQLLQMSNRLQLAVRATAIGIWDWDIVNNTTDWDDEMFRMYDVKRGEYPSITAAWEAVLHPDDLERVKHELDTALKGGKEYDTEFRITCKDKSVRYIKGNALVLYDHSGNPVRMIGTNGDITERKNAEEEILQLNKNLEQFANITAHDLQEPIRMVSGFLGLLDKKYASIIDAQGKSYIDRAKDGADRMSILIRDLLEFSRSANKAAKKEPVDLRYVLELVHKDMGIVMEDTSANFFVPNTLPVVEGTQSALYRLFLNLVSNGIKFRKKDTIPEVSISILDSADSWEFIVQDNGIGVPEKDQPKLFQAFHRLHRKEDYPGTGLGLVTCKKIVETHGGRIWMTSEYGKGTGFHFTLPKMRA